MPEPSGGTPVKETFSSTEGHFRFGMPGRAGEAEDKNKKTSKWWILNVGEFQILYVDRGTPADTPEVSQTVINNFRDLASSRGKLISESEISVSGHPGREFRIGTDGGTQIDRIYLAGKEIIFLNCACA